MIVIKTEKLKDFINGINFNKINIEKNKIVFNTKNFKVFMPANTGHDTSEHYFESEDANIMHLMIQNSDKELILNKNDSSFNDGSLKFSSNFSEDSETNNEDSCFEPIIEFSKENLNSIENDFEIVKSLKYFDPTFCGINILYNASYLRAAAAGYYLFKSTSFIGSGIIPDDARNFLLTKEIFEAIKKTGEEKIILGKSNNLPALKCGDILIVLKEEVPFKNTAIRVKLALGKETDKTIKLETLKTISNLFSDFPFISSFQDSDLIINIKDGTLNINYDDEQQPFTSKVEEKDCSLSFCPASLKWFIKNYKKDVANFLILNQEEEPFIIYKDDNSLYLTKYLGD